MATIRYLTYTGLVLLTLSARAENVPVEDLGQPADLERPAYLDDNTNYDEQVDSKITTEQRLDKLEAQLKNITQQNMFSSLNDVRQEVQILRGQLEKQQHDIQVIATQQKQFYQDLNSRIVSSSKPKTVENQADKVESSVSKAQQAPVVAAEENKLYRDAFELLKSKQYNDAINAFQVYLSKFPSGNYTVNSYYWIGEIYYLQGKSEEAKKAFSSVANNFPNSQKVPDALLKLAIIEIDAGKVDQGRTLLEKVQRQYPGTTAARLAALRYQELRLST